MCKIDKSLYVSVYSVPGCFHLRILPDLNLPKLPHLVYDNLRLQYVVISMDFKDAMREIDGTKTVHHLMVLWGTMLVPMF